MIAECLRDYIGLPGCTDEPESGLNISDQPGISLVSIDRIADSEKQTYKNVFDIVQTRAINRISSDLIATFAKRYHLKRLPESFKIREYVDTSDTTAPAAEYRGINIELELIGDTQYAYSGLQFIYVQAIRCYSINAVNGVDFKVIDQDTFETLETFTVNLASGWNTVAVDKHYLSYNLFIGYDATLITSATLLLVDDSCCGCGSGCGALVQGSTWNSATQTLTTGTNTFGLAGTYAIQCSFETILCNNKHLFKTALFNCLAYELMRERVYTERINKFTTVDREIAKNEMMPDFYEQYQKELIQAVDGIDLNSGDCCLICDAVVQYRETKTW